MLIILIIFQSTSHFLKENSDKFQLIGAVQEMRIFYNRFKRKPADIFEKNLLINFIENIISYILERKKSIGDFNFMIVFMIFLFTLVSGK